MEFSRPTIAMAQQTQLESIAYLRPIRTWKLWTRASFHHRSIRLPRATISIIRADYRAQRIFRKTQLRRHCPNGWIWIALANTRAHFRNLPVPMCFACPKTIWFKYADSLTAFVCTTHCIRSKYSFVPIVPHTQVISLTEWGCYFRALAPRLTIYVSFDGNSYHAIYLHENTTKELAQKMFKLPGFTEYLTSSPTNIENSGFAGWSKSFSIPKNAPLISEASTYTVYIFLVQICSRNILVADRTCTTPPNRIFISMGRPASTSTSPTRCSETSRTKVSLRWKLSTTKLWWKLSTRMKSIDFSLWQRHRLA